jgi:hypothetical protein
MKPILLLKTLSGTVDKCKKKVRNNLDGCPDYMKFHSVRLELVERWARVFPSDSLCMNGDAVR